MGIGRNPDDRGNADTDENAACDPGHGLATTVYATTGRCEYAASDIGVPWRDPDTPIIISVYTRGGTPGEAQCKTLFSGVAKAVTATLAWQAFTPPAIRSEIAARAGAGFEQ